VKQSCPRSKFAPNLPSCPRSKFAPNFPVEQSCPVSKFARSAKFTQGERERCEILASLFSNAVQSFSFSVTIFCILYNNITAFCPRRANLLIGQICRIAQSLTTKILPLTKLSYIAKIGEHLSKTLHSS